MRLAQRRILALLELGLHDAAGPVDPRPTSPQIVAFRVFEGVTARAAVSTYKV
jgi:hypothetical protein